MATKIVQEGDTSLTIEYNNGDLAALREIKEKWNFKDLESVLRFGLAVLAETKEGVLCKQEADTSITVLRPTQDTKR